MGVNWLIAIGAVFDIGLGMWLIGYSTDAAAKKQAVKLGAALLLLLSAVMIFGRAKPEIMASGVFRKGKLPVEGKTEVLYARDGKTATVHMIRNYEEGTLSIVTNGKVDASIAEDPDRNSPDEPTMALLGALPLALKPDAKFVANIGIGSGMTTHTLLQWPGLERVDTIEIEPFMVEGARMYGKRVERTFSDPRSFIRIEDAKTYFTAAKQKYDLIISEPSNPWVSGVAGLFSSEFYSHAARHMSKGALFVQWIHLYEIDYESAASVIKAIEKNFHDYELYFTNDIDLLIVASADGKVPQLSGEIFSAPELKRTLGGLGIVSKTDLNLRKIGDRAMLSPFFGLFAVEANSDYYPVLDQRAAKARFLNKNVVSLSQIAFSPLPLWRLSPAREHPLNGGQEPGENKFFQFGRKAQKAKALMSVIIGEDEHIPLPHLLEDEAMALAHGECHNEVTSKIWVGALSDLAPQLLPYLTENDLAQVWKAIEGSACYRSGPSFVRQWVELFRASRSGDIPALEKASGALLEIKGWKKHDRVLLLPPFYF